VPLFVADWTIGVMTAERLVEFRRLLQVAADRVSSQGTVVRFMRCTHVPEQTRCICLFEADDIEAVRSVNQIAQAPFAQIGLAIEFYRANESSTDGRKSRGEETG
jgi:hypothetical protein